MRQTFFLLLCSDFMAYGTKTQYGSTLSPPQFWLSMWCDLQLDQIIQNLCTTSNSLDNNYIICSEVIVELANKHFKFLWKEVVEKWKNYNSDSCNITSLKKIAHCECDWGILQCLVDFHWWEGTYLSKNEKKYEKYYYKNNKDEK